MQIPIQSLNTVHSKYYDFSFNHDIFKYHLINEELYKIELVLESGKVFELSEDIVESTHNKRKREKKQRNKEDRKESDGIDVTELVKEVRREGKR